MEHAHAGLRVQEGPQYKSGVVREFCAVKLSVDKLLPPVHSSFDVSLGSLWWEFRS